MSVRKSVCLILLVGVVTVARAHTARPPLQLDRVDFWTDIYAFSLADLDGDGQDEIIRLSSDHRTFFANRISRTRPLSPAMYQGNSVYQIESITPVDIDTLPGHELAIASRDPDGDSIWIEIICGYDKEISVCRTEAIVGKDISDRGSLSRVGWDGAVHSVHAVDLDNDGIKELIVPVVVGFDLYPRGIYVYSYPSGKLRWRFLLAGNPDQPWFADANNDGFKEVFVKTHAVSNGAVDEDRTDNTAYEICLDHLGHPIWRQTMGDRFDMGTGNVHICDCDNDGVIEIYYTDLARQDDYDKQVRILEKHRAKDNAFLKQRSFDADQVFYQISTADLNNDSLKEILVDGFIGIMNPTDLSKIRMGNFRKAGIWVVDSLYDDESGSLEIVLTQKDSLYIVDLDLNVLGVTYAGEGYRYLTVRCFSAPSGQRYLAALMTTDNPEIPNVVSVYTIRKIPADAIGMQPIAITGWALALAALLVGLSLGTVIGLAVRRNQKRRIREPKSAQYENLLTSLANFDHGRMGGKNLNRLQFLFSNLPESPEKLEQIQPNIRAAAEAYHAHTESQLRNVVQYGVKLKPIQPFVTDLMQHTGRLSNLMTEEIIRDLEATDTFATRTAITESIERIQVAIRQVRKTVQSYFSADLLRVIPGVLIAIVPHLRECGVGFRTIETRGGPLRLVFFDEVSLAAIFEELLSNACDAMADSDKRELIMLIDFGVDEVIIRLSDTGSGLQGADSEKLFRREYSTKRERGGYGLYNAQQQVERFGGRIKIYNNENGPGATVEMILKTVHNG